LPVQYADYTAWLGRWLTGEVLERQLAYWTQQLADAPAELALPYRAQPANPTYEGGRCKLALDAALVRRLRALGHAHGATQFMVLVATLRALLARITGQRDLCIGTVVANRDRAELEGVIGMFVNTLVVRGVVRPGDRFVDLLARERDLALSAHAHAHAPFERVVDALDLPRDPDRMPLIQVMCVDQGEVISDPALPGLTSEPFLLGLEIADFDLTLTTCERAGVVELAVTYRTDRFERETVAALVERYQRVLAEIAERPDQPLAALAQALVLPAERAALFEQPARCVTWEPRGPGVLAQIERWMAETPGAPALLWEAGRVDYSALDARSAALAMLLRRRGVGPDRTVAVIAERGAMQVIAFLAVLRAGGAYVPI
jgi:non-ribosomal peptide synthetase component F